MSPLSRRVVPAAVAAIVLVLSACGSHDDSHGSMTTGGDNPTSASAQTATGVDADVMFAQMMIPHHAQAVEMADLALGNDTASEAVQALAAQIKAAQGPEIETMTAWLNQWGAQVSGGSMDHGVDGMMSAQDMSRLTGATGTEFDRLWLTMMIAHHEGAITMARDVLDTTTNPEVTDLATAVVAGQEEEITTMQGMLG